MLAVIRIVIQEATPMRHLSWQTTLVNGMILGNPSRLPGFGLRVAEGERITLLGGNVSMDGGGLNALGGHVEVDGLSEPSHYSPSWRKPYSLSLTPSFK